VRLKRPTLTSVTCGTPAASALRSNAEESGAARSSAVTAARQTSTTAGSFTERASEATDDTPLGWLPPPK